MSYHSDINLCFITDEIIGWECGRIHCFCDSSCSSHDTSLSEQMGDRRSKNKSQISDCHHKKRFVDDLIITTESRMQAKCILTALEGIVSYAKNDLLT